MDELGRYFETVRSLPSDPPSLTPTASGLGAILTQEPPPELREIVGPFLESARKMGECTARLHQAVAGELGDPAFAPQPLTAVERQGLFQGLRRKIGLVLQLLRGMVKSRSPQWTPVAQRLLDSELRLLQSAQDLLKASTGCARIRCHGDLGLRQFFSTGNEYILSSVPASLSGPFIERRIKRSPMWDVAAMVTSFRQATEAALADQEARGEGAAERWTRLEKGAASWLACVVHTYVRAYSDSLSDPRLICSPPDQGNAPLKLSLLEQGLDRLHAALASGSGKVPAELHRLLDLVEPPPLLPAPPGPEVPPPPAPRPPGQ